MNGLPDIRDFDMTNVEQVQLGSFVNLYDQSDVLYEWIQRCYRDCNFTYVSAHGAPELMMSQIVIDGEYYPKTVYTAEDIADLLIEAGWNGEIVYLLACNTGRYGVCGISQEIADFLGGVVRAPKEALNICSNGFYYVSDEERWDFDSPDFLPENQALCWDERIALTY